MSGPAEEALAHHVGKWQRREPEMVFAEVFCPTAQRPRFRAWGALLFELREAAFELSDPRLIAVKSGWWAEELLALAQGHPRHALTGAFAGLSAPWPELARGLLQLAGSETRPADADAALDALRPLASAVNAVENALFDARGGAGAIAAVAVHLLSERLPRGLANDDLARIPMNLLARHGLTAAALAAGEGDALLRDWAGELLRRLPVTPGPASLYRGTRLAFDRARLERLAAGRGFDPAPAPATLWRAWRAARLTSTARAPI